MIFLVIDQVFLIFRIFTVFWLIDWLIDWLINVAYDPFSTRKTTISENEFLDNTFVYSVRTFARILQDYFSKYWGTDAWAAPPQILGGRTVPQSLLGLRPCLCCRAYCTAVLVEYMPNLVMWMKYVPKPKFSLLTLQQHPLLHRCVCGDSVVAVRGGNHWNSLEKKQDRPRQTDNYCCWRRLLGCLHQCHWFVSVMTPNQRW